MHEPHVRSISLYGIIVIIIIIIIIIITIDTYKAQYPLIAQSAVQ